MTIGYDANAAAGAAVVVAVVDDDVEPPFVFVIVAVMEAREPVSVPARECFENSIRFRYFRLYHPTV